MSIDRVIAQVAGLDLVDFPALANSSSPVVQVSDPSSAAGKGGRLASRLIQDWLAGRYVEVKPDLPGGFLPDGRQGEPLTQCPPLRVFPPRPDAGHDHDLVIIPSQSYDEAHDPEGRGRSLVSCMCKYCRYHFVFHIYPLSPEDSTAHLQHHFLVEQAEWRDVSKPAVSQRSKQNLCQGRFQYGCTLCGITIDVEISLPRLDPAWIKLIMDEKRVRECLRVAKEQDPGRYADTTPEKETQYLTGGLFTLNQYLKNILEDNGTGPRKRISRRNKTFQVQFGRDCDRLFQCLGFEEEHDQETKETYWLPPRLQTQEGKTPVGSPRAFYEDARSEVQSLLDDKPPVGGQPVVKPILSARDSLEKALRCDRSHRCVSTLPVDPNEAPHFTTLGAPIDADDALLKFAFSRQVATDPEQTSTYLESLGILSARRSEELQLFAVTRHEMLAKKQREATAAAPDATPSDKAYAHFGLSKACTEEPAYFIRVYRTYREQSPAQKSDHRLALLEIAKDRNSQEIKNEVFLKEMELSEACRFLSVESEWPMDSIAAMAQSTASESDFDRGTLVLMALDAISRSRPADDPNRPSFEHIVAELRSSHQSEFLASGPDHAAAGAVSERSREPVDVELPVGLANLRNTCYLNSILQYFYSVNAVRDLAVNTEFTPLEPTEVNLSHILRSSSDDSNNNTVDSANGSQTDLETGRAFVGHEFTRELSTLFRELDASGDSSVHPRQRLANAALLRPEKLRPRSAESTDTPGASNNDAPPLPPRTGENAVSAPADTPMADVDQSETASTGSSQTLVGQPDLEGPTPAAAEDRSAEKSTAMAMDGPAEQAPSDPAVGGASGGGANMSKLTVEELAAELDKPNVGSDQMDVDEVMGNAIDHLRAAFKVSNIGDFESAQDPIEQAFFSTFIDNRKKIGEPDWNRTSRSDRWVTAYPAQSGTRDLYDALANSFDLERLPGGLLSFTTIERPAPHFHICIQRSDGVRKNANPITIPETLYLDRFMHTADRHSQLFKHRKRKWDIKTRLSEIASPAARERLETATAESQVAGRFPNNNTQNDELTEEEIDGFLVIGEPGASSHVPDSSMTNVVNGHSGSEHAAPSPDLKQLLSKYNVDEPSVSQVTAAEPPPQKAAGSTPLLHSDLESFWNRFVALENEERERLTAERDRIFSESQEVAYRLHAVVCHAGTTASAGHYWVWIHDFERDIWRKYNDTTVSVHPAEYVFGELNTKGEPYYLAYVKADEVPNLVSIPRRKPLAAPAVPPRPPSGQDTVVVDSRDGVVTTVERVEDVEMTPPPDVVP